MLNKELLKKYVSEYKENIEEWRLGKNREIYKWEAVEHFKRNWNIDAPNFVEMLENALGKTENLLTAGMFFPKSMLLGLASKEPETVREMFKKLFDENKDITQRVSNFISEADELHKRNLGGKRHYQEPRAISVYLWLKYPEKYYIYQYEFLKKVVNELDGDHIIKKSRKPDSMMEGYRFFEEIKAELKNDIELVQLNYDNGVAGFKDEGLTTLTQDVAFFIKGQIDEQWEPKLEEYNPKISVEQWKELLNKNEVFTETAKRVIRCMLQLGGQATCKQLADKFGETYNFYNGVSIALAKRVQKETNCPMPPSKDEDAERYWPILYVGRNVKGEQGVFEWKLRDELKDAWTEVMEILDVKIKEPKIMPRHSKNQILYGPPGTGKTYNTVNYAVAIVDNRDVEDVMKEASTKEGRKKIQERYKLLKKEGLIEFCTFHQSYGYEEFIEGIKPDFVNNGVNYKLEAGAFKSFCNAAEVALVGKDDASEIREHPTIWKVSLQGTGDNIVRKDCMDNEYIRIGYGDELSEKEIMTTTQGVLGRFVNSMQIGDIVISCYTENEFDAVGVVTGECKVLSKFKDYRQSRAVKWLVKNIREDIRGINDGKKMTLSAVYSFPSISLADILAVIKKYTKIESDNRNRVFIIDEINRGNISKIFGELITLIEETKRIGEIEEMRARLPYSGEKFGVPQNVYLLGTMNTADRSIALIDTALRRRFKFVEMQPNVELLNGIEVEGIKIKDMLEVINKRIELLYDREHTIGHSFFMGLSNTSTIADLAEIFECNVIPLLKEYFYNDFERIAAVLGDDLNKNDANVNFILRENDYVKIPNSEIEVPPAYKFNFIALEKPEAYKKIYE